MSTLSDSERLHLKKLIYPLLHHPKVFVKIQVHLYQAFLLEKFFLLQYIDHKIYLQLKKNLHQKVLRSLQR